jgi:hypothetical protein
MKINLLLVLALGSLPLPGATLITSALAPAVNGGDVAQLVGSADLGGNEGHIWNNRPAQGQLFVTGSDPAGYTLNSFTMRNLNNTTSGSFTVRISRYDNRTLTTLASESTGTASYVPGDFLTAQLGTPVALAPNSIYAVDFAAPGSGFVTSNNTNTNSLLPGFAYSSGINGVGNTALTARAGDRVFHADLSIGGISTGATLSSHGRLSVSSTAPVVDGADIANLLGTTDVGGDAGHIWNNRPVQGQSFTTGTHDIGYLLDGVTLQNLSNTVPSSGLFTIQVGEISGNTLTPVSVGTTFLPASYVPGDFITFFFDDPVQLDPLKQYGFDWGTTGAGFVTANSSTSLYGGGSLYSSGANNSPNNGALVFGAGNDRVFHLNLTLAPEPGRTALAMLACLPLFLVRQRKR